MRRLTEAMPRVMPGQVIRVSDALATAMGWPVPCPAATATVRDIIEAETVPNAYVGRAVVRGTRQPVIWRQGADAWETTRTTARTF